MPRIRRSSAHLVTEAHRSRSQDIADRERRYLVTMGIRIVCFVVAVVLFAQGLGWLAAIPVVGAILIPYFAVVFANAGRDASASKGFRAFEPRLPVPYQPPDPKPGPGDSAGREGAPGGGGGHSGYPPRTENR